MIAFVVAWDGRRESDDDVLWRLNDANSRVETAVETQHWAAATASGRASHVAWLPSARLLACFDGWLDDLGVLRTELGCDPSVSPAHVLLAGYCRHGEQLTQYLRGDYAFVIWDAARNMVFAARDPFGVRPLHYVSAEQRLYFASGADQLVRAGIRSVAPDDRMVVEFLVRRVVAHDRSFFRDVRQLPAGHQLSAARNEIRIAEHRRRPPKEVFFSDRRECLEAVRGQLEIAVRRSLSTGERAVIELSGGIDSTALTLLADRLEGVDGGLARRTLAVAGLHPGLECDESSYIHQVTRATRIPVISWDATRVDSRDLSDPLFAAPGSAVVMSGGGNGMVSIARQHGATIVLNGTGGDQVGETLGVLADKLRFGHWREAFMDLARSGLSTGQSVRALLRAAHELAPARLRRLRRMARSPILAPPWLTPSAIGFFRDSIAEEDAEDDARHSTAFLSPAHRLRWRNLTSARLSFSLDTRQRFASAHALEARFPFLDWDLVSLLLAVPIQYWPVSRLNPRIHREALATILPPSLYQRRTKAEFTPAMANRVTAQLSFIEDLFGGKTWESAGYVSQVQARRLLAAFQRTRAPEFSLVYGVWAIAALEAWLRKVLRYTPGTYDGDKSHVR